MSDFNKLESLIKIGRGLGIPDEEIKRMIKESMNELTGKLDSLFTKPTIAETTPYKHLRSAIGMCVDMNRFTSSEVSAFLSLYFANLHPDWDEEDLSRCFVICSQFAKKIPSLFDDFVNSLSEEDKAAVEKGVAKDLAFYNKSKKTEEKKDDGGPDRDASHDVKEQTQPDSTKKDAEEDADVDELAELVFSTLDDKKVRDFLDTLFWGTDRNN